MRIGKSAFIGIVTGLTMILTSLLLFYMLQSQSSQWQMIVYGIYAAGILWGQHQYSKKKEVPHTFKNLFAEGFKVFMPVTLMMVLYTWIFLKINTELIEQMAEGYRNQLLLSGNRTPDQIETEVIQSKDKYATFFTSLAIFGYLIAGAIATLAGAVFFGSRNNK